MPWCRTSGAAITSWRLRSQWAGGWRSIRRAGPGGLIQERGRRFNLPRVGATQQSPSVSSANTQLRAYGRLSGTHKVERLAEDHYGAGVEDPQHDGEQPICPGRVRWTGFRHPQPGSTADRRLPVACSRALGLRRTLQIDAARAAALAWARPCRREVARQRVRRALRQLRRRAVLRGLPIRSGWSRDRQPELVGRCGHPVVVGDDPGQVSAELLGGREVNGVQGSELDRQHRAGGIQDAIIDPY
jgi:hypothetical protein